MTAITRPLRIAPAFDDRPAVEALFAEHSPYPAAAQYLPDGSDDTGEPKPPDAVWPWFRATWALGGEPRVAGAEVILENPRFLAAARQMFPDARVVPKTLVVNVNAPMPAGVPHVDVPSFRGATREALPLKLLIAMGASALFEPWRTVEAGAISWFYDGPGGGFDYWPDGPAGAMQHEPPPFGNVAIVADNDRMYHRIGAIGPPDAVLPRMSAAATIRLDDDAHWSIYEDGECRARYRRAAIRLSVLWKAEAVHENRRGSARDALSVAQIVEMLQRDLLRRGEAPQLPANPVAEPEWIAQVYRVYTRAASARAPSVPQG
jgi:hypothetical protein